MIKLLRGEQAHAWYNDEATLAAWRVLHEQTPWATPYQSPEFVATWFDVYAAHYEPILVYQADGNALSGLLCLARHRRDGTLVHAGAHQAEYQAWLCRSGHSFLPDALGALADAGIKPALRLRYLPPGTPLEALQGHAAWSKQLRVTTHARPLLRITPEGVLASLQKKGNKSKLNRLKKLGELELLQVENVAQFDAFFDEFATQYDFRQFAVNAVAPFREDPLKLQFHRALLQRAPALVHFTILRVGSAVAAGHWGLIGRREVHLCLLGHSPTLAAHSPGKLHLLLLGQLLAKAGIECLDLTPGGDPWKERFATDHDQVTELSIYPSAWAAAKSRWREEGPRRVKQMLIRMGIQPQALRRTQAVDAEPAREQSLYQWRANAEQGATNHGHVKQDDLKSLFRFHGQLAQTTVQRRHSAWLANLESGDDALTASSSDQTRVLAWRSNSSASVKLQLQETGADDEAALLYGLEFSGDDQAGLTDALGSIVANELAMKPNRRLWLLLEDGERWHHVLDRAGFAFDRKIKTVTQVARETENASE